VVAPSSGIKRKLNENAPLQTFPYPMVSNKFIVLTPNGYVAVASFTIQKSDRDTKKPKKPQALANQAVATSAEWPCSKTP